MQDRQMWEHHSETLAQSWHTTAAHAVMMMGLFPIYCGWLRRIDMSATSRCSDYDDKLLLPLDKQEGNSFFVVCLKIHI